MQNDNNIEHTMESSTAKKLSIYHVSEILDKLPPAEQLKARRLSKEWETAAGVVLKRKQRFRLRLCNAARLNDFLLTFGPPRFPVMKIMPLLDVELMVPWIKLERIQKFGERNAEPIRFLTVDFPKVVEPWMNTKAKILLNYCPNLETICLRSGHYTDPRDIEENMARIGAEMPQIEKLSQTQTLRQFEKLRQLQIYCPTSQIPCLQEIVDKAPKLEVVDLGLYETENLDPITPTFLKTFESIQLQKLVIKLTLDDIPEEMTFLKELFKVDLKPSEVLICLGRKLGDLRDEEEFMDKKILQDWLAKLDQTATIQKLILRYDYPDPIRIDFPVMPHLLTLDIGPVYTDVFGHGIVDPSEPLTPAQVPCLRTFVAGFTGIIFKPSAVFPTVRELVLRPTWYLYRPDPDQSELSPPVSYLWSNLFPNLTRLEICVMRSSVNTLVPILLRMRNLTQLRVNLNFYLQPYEPYDPTRIWDLLTGGIRPILDKNCSLDLILPKDSEDNGSEPSLLDPQIPSLGNLQNLKVMELDCIVPSILLAVVHLTFMKKLKRLETLKMEMDPNIYDFKLHHACVDVLKQGHGYVELRGLSPNNAN